MGSVNGSQTHLEKKTGLSICMHARPIVVWMEAGVKSGGSLQTGVWMLGTGSLTF